MKNDYKSAEPAISLLTEVMDSHKDPNSPDFNDCLDGRECQWCVEAKQWIDAKDQVELKSSLVDEHSLTN